MADEEKKDAEPGTHADKSSLRPVIFASAAAFLVALGGFSYLQGLFGPPAATGPDPLAVDVAVGSVDSPGGALQPAPRGSTAAPEAQASAEIGGEPGPEASSFEEEAWLRREKRKLAEQKRALERRRRELDQLKKEIEGLLARVEEARSERIGMMAKLYDSMDPEAVAKQITNMDDHTVVNLIPRMNTRTAAKVLALLDPKRAAHITSKILAMEP